MGIPPADPLTAAMEAAWAADLAWARSPNRERGGMWGAVPEDQLRRLLAGAWPVFRDAERRWLGCRVTLAAVDLLQDAGGIPSTARVVRAVPLVDLFYLLDHPEEAPVPDLNAGREEYPPARSFTVITAGGLLAFAATSCHESDEWLVLENAGRTVGKFRLSEIAGYFENAPKEDRTVTEARSA